MSEYARSAVLAQMASERSSRGLLMHDLITLGAGLRALDTKLADLRHIIQSLLGEAAGTVNAESHVNGSTKSVEACQREAELLEANEFSRW